MISRVKILIIFTLLNGICDSIAPEYELYAEGDTKAPTLRLIHTVQVPHPSALNFYIKENKKAKEYTLLISSFLTGVNTKDNAYLWTGLKNLTASQPLALPPILYWPKDISAVPADAFSFDAITIPDGADVMGKGDGRVILVDISDVNFQKYFDLTSPKAPSKKNFIFGRTVWVDLGGILSNFHFLTCRRSVSESRNQLVLYHSHAIGDELNRPWVEVILKENACDANLAYASIKQAKNTFEVVYATGKVTKSLNFFWPENSKGNPGSWNVPEDIRGLVLDKDREYFDVQVADVNKDGFLDVIVTVQEGPSTKNGTVEVWQIDPLNFRDVKGYVRHVIAWNFAPKDTQKDSRSPGAIRLFYPDKESEKGKPWLLLAGADSGKAYYLVPQSNDQFNWNYTKVEIDFGAVVEQNVHGVGVGDVDGDGYAEIFVSLYKKNTINVYSFKPPVTTTTKTSAATIVTTTATTKKPATTISPTTQKPTSTTSTTTTKTTSTTSTSTTKTTTNKPLLQHLIELSVDERDDATKEYIRKLERLHGMN